MMDAVLILFKLLTKKLYLILGLSAICPEHLAVNK